MNTATKTFLLVSAAYLLGGGSAALGEAQVRSILEDHGTEDHSEGQAPGRVPLGSTKVVTEGERIRSEDQCKGEGKGRQE